MSNHFANKTRVIFSFYALSVMALGCLSIVGCEIRSMAPVSVSGFSEVGLLNDLDDEQAEDLKIFAVRVFNARGNRNYSSKRPVVSADMDRVIFRPSSLIDPYGTGYQWEIRRAVEIGLLPQDEFRPVRKPVAIDWDKMMIYKNFEINRVEFFGESEWVYVWMSFLHEGEQYAYSLALRVLVDDHIDYLDECSQFVEAAVLLGAKLK